MYVYGNANKLCCCCCVHCNISRSSKTPTPGPGILQSRGDRLAMNRSAPTTRLYSEVVKKDTDLETSPTWLRNYQREDEEEAMKRALNESVKVTISVEE